MRLMDIVNNGRRKDQQGHSEQDYQIFVDMISQMLSYTPTERATPSALLQHPFVAPLSKYDPNAGVHFLSYLYRSISINE